MIKILNSTHVIAMVKALKEFGFNILESTMGYEMVKSDGSHYKAAKCPWVAVKKNTDFFIVRFKNDLFI